MADISKITPNGIMGFYVTNDGGGSWSTIWTK